MEVRSVAEDILRRTGVAFKSLSVIHVNRGTATETSLALLIFIDEGRDPLAFMKVTPEPEKAGLFEQEFNNLTFLHNHGSPQFKRTIPEPLYFGKFNHFTILAETAKPGTRMKNFPPNAYFSSKRFRQHFKNVVQWLYEFHHCMADSQPQSASADIKKMVTDPVREYRQSFQRSAKLDFLLDEIQQCLQHSDIPLHLCHGDFCTANILFSDAQQISVIDWEDLVVNGWPLSDLLYFISSIWCIPYKKGQSRLANNFRHLFSTQNRHADLIRQSVAWYMQKLGIKADLVLPLSIMAWVLYANAKRAILEETQAIVRDGSKSSQTLPLIMIEDDYCLNLEMLAENRDGYILNLLF